MNTSVRNFWVLIAILFAGVLLTTGIMLLNGDKSLEVERELNQTMNEMTEVGKQYNTFMAEAQNKEAENAQIEIDKTDIISKESKNVMTVSKFAELIGVEIGADNNFTYNEFQVLSNDYTIEFNGDAQKYVLFDELLEALGYTYTIEQDKAIVSRACFSKRLVVEGDINNISSASQLNVLDSTILQFDTEKEAIDNYNLISQSHPVFIDTTRRLDPEPVVEDEENEFEAQNLSAQNLSAQGAYSAYSSYKGVRFNSWGGDTMGFYYYNTYLLEVCNGKLRDTTVVVVDSGINYDHEIFKGRLSPYSMSFVAGQTSAQYKDEVGHGTHVAGTICELTNSNVKILTIRVLDKNGEGYMSSTLLGYTYVLKLLDKGLDICAVNASFGGYGGKGSLRIFEEKKVDEIRSRGVLFCAAAGNEAQDANEHCPSAYEGSMAVSSINQQSRLSSFSNYGSCVEFTAPGEHIWSADYQNVNDLCELSGTSMATPHITAAVAAIASDSRNNYTGDEIEDLLRNICAVDLGAKNRDDKFGYGYINLRNLIDNNVDIYSEEPKDYRVYIGIDREDYDESQGNKIFCDYTNFARVSKSLTIYDYNSFGINKISAISKLKFEVYVKPDYDFIGWYVGVNDAENTRVYNYDSSRIYSTEKIISIKDSDYESGNIYVIAKLKKKTVNVKIVFTFEDVADVNGLMYSGVDFFVEKAKLNNVYKSSYSTTNIRYRDPMDGYYKPTLVYDPIEQKLKAETVFTFEKVPLLSRFYIRLCLTPGEAELKDRTVVYDGERGSMFSIRDEEGNILNDYERSFDIVQASNIVEGFVFVFTILV